MPRTARKLSNSGYYHIVSRGNGKQILFEEEADYLFFLKTLSECLKEESFEVIAYCLMENHFHLLLKIGSDMDRIMQKISTTYALYYNSKYERSGHLFQDRYRSIPIENDLALLSVVRYIHNNPVKAGICPVDKYRWSSWRAYYTGKSSQVSTRLVLELTGGLNGFLTLSGQEDDVADEHRKLEDNRRLPDDHAQQIIKDILRLESGTKIQDMGKNDRNTALHTLKEEGLSIRQIERLTGISRSIIMRA